MRKLMFILPAILIGLTGMAQTPGKDKAKFKEYKPGYYQNFILKDVRAVKKKEKAKPKVKYFTMDQSGMDLPNKMSYYKDHTFWHQPTTSQGNTGTCWCFSTTSFYESEVYRISGKKVRISEMFTVYWEYVRKAKGFIESRGKTLFSEGSEGNAVTLIYKEHGAVPRSVYSGLTGGRKFFDHSQMYKEMNGFLQSVKKSNAWDEEAAVRTIKAIMNHYMGTPPTEFEFEGKKYTPKSWLKDYLKLNPNDYIEVLSYMQQPYWQKVEYEVPDNWWHSKEYYNVPLDVFMDILHNAVKDGYTCSIGGDVSESSFSRETNTALIADYDIPSAYINEYARQFRFSNHTTTDDHGMHLVGYYIDKAKRWWFLIKDSSSGSRNIGEDKPEFGYYFFSDDYVKLKMMGYTIHKDALKKYLSKFK